MLSVSFFYRLHNYLKQTRKTFDTTLRSDKSIVICESSTKSYTGLVCKFLIPADHHIIYNVCISTKTANKRMGKGKCLDSTFFVAILAPDQPYSMQCFRFDCQAYEQVAGSCRVVELLFVLLFLKSLLAVPVKSFDFASLLLCSVRRGATRL